MLQLGGESGENHNHSKQNRNYIEKIKDIKKKKGRRTLFSLLVYKHHFVMISLDRTQWHTQLEGETRPTKDTRGLWIYMSTRTE